MKTESRHVRQQRIQAELISNGMQMFSQQGFEETTTLDISKAVGISRRTFFRYFNAKDDLVFHWMDEQGEVVCNAIANRPSTEHPIVSLQQAYRVLTQALDTNSTKMLSQAKLIFSTASLRRRYHEESEKWENQFFSIFNQRKKLTDKQKLSLQVHISTTTTTFVVAIRNWSMANHDLTLSYWVENAFAALNEKTR